MLVARVTVAVVGLVVTLGCVTRRMGHLHKDLELSAQWDRIGPAPTPMVAGWPGAGPGAGIAGVGQGGWGVRTPGPAVLVRRPASERPIVAVFDVEDRGAGLADETRVRFGDYIATQLAATGRYQVVPRDQLKQRLRDQKKDSYKACYEQSCQIEIGREIAAQKSLSSQVMRLGSRCTVTSVIYDLKRSVSEGGATSEGGCTEDDIVSSLRTVVAKLSPTAK